MDFAPHKGCPMCGIVAKAQQDADASMAFQPGLSRAAASGSANTAPDIIWRDDNFTVYRERAHPVSSRGHLIVVFK